VLDNYRQSLLVFYLKELSLADEKEEFIKYYNSDVERMIHDMLIKGLSNKEDLIQILDYGNSIENSLKVA